MQQGCAVPLLALGAVLRAEVETPWGGTAGRSERGIHDTAVKRPFTNFRFGSSCRSLHDDPLQPVTNARFALGREKPIQGRLCGSASVGEWFR
jgi:hypothetical protein